MSSPKMPAPNAVWDWPLIEALYIAGMSVKDIVAIPRFRDLNPTMIYQRKGKKGWDEIRERARAEGAGAIAAPLIERIGNAVQLHQTFMLDALEHERKVYEKTRKDEGGAMQVGRLEILRKIDDLARRLLGMDDMKPLNDQQKSLGILIGLSQNGGKTQMAVRIEQSDNRVSNIANLTPKVNLQGRPMAEVLAEVSAEILRGEEAVSKEQEGLPRAKPLSFGKVEESEEEDLPDIVTLVNESNLGLIATELRPADPLGPL